jgi:membrane protein required for beta-lactamase induction
LTRFDILYVAQYRIIYYNVLYLFHTAQWLSWLERRPVTAEVESSSLFWVVHQIRLLLFIFYLIFLKVDGVLAQLGEHLPYKQRVIGSSPIGPIPYAAVAELADARDLKSRG